MKLLHNVRLHSGVCVGHAPLIQSKPAKKIKMRKRRKITAHLGAITPRQSWRWEIELYWKCWAKKNDLSQYYTQAASWASVSVQALRPAYLAVFPQCQPGEDCCNENKNSELAKHYCCYQICLFALTALRGPERWRDFCLLFSEQSKFPL